VRLSGDNPTEYSRVNRVDQLADWQSQITRELAILREVNPNAVADIGEAIEEVGNLGSTLLIKHDVELRVPFVQSDLNARIHPSVLHQTLLSAIGRLAQYAKGGEIAVFAGLENGNVKLTFVTSTTTDKIPKKQEIDQHIIVPENTKVDVQIDGDNVFLSITLSAFGKNVILVVDDNTDMIDLYQRSTEGTTYLIIPAFEGRSLFEKIKTYHPQIIVLDVMLPDIDGWKLLMRLHENPDTQSIPVIVSTVVREKELALLLGATAYLAKPVRPHQFVEALDRVMSQVQ
jgi:CheY-like chemotaxis protein